MRSVLLLIFLSLLSVSWSQGYTKIKNSAECKSRIEQKAKSTSAISANFSETIFSSLYNNPKQGAGILKYKKSNKIRWEHSSPKKQIVLINGSKVRLFENGKENKNAASSQVIKKVQSLMIQLFSGEFLNEKEFYIDYYESTADYKLILRPKSSRMSKYISKVEMYMDKKTLVLNKMSLIENEDERIEYTFSKVQYNTSIPETSFTQF